MTKYRKPFYASEMHNDSNFSIHQYFTTDIQHRGLSKLKQFVDVPCPFGVQNTYKYLRKANLHKLPFITQIKINKARNILSHLHTSVYKNDNPNNRRSISSNFSSITLQTTIFPRKTQFIMKVCMFDEIKQVKDFSQYCINIDLMKYLRNCFLKCKLHLESLSLIEWRMVEKYVWPTIRNRERKGRELESPLVLLGVLEMRTKEDFINKLKELDEEGRNIEIYQLIQHFIIPDDEIISYQLQSIRQQINRVYKFKKITNVNSVCNLFLLDGTLVQNFFQLTTNNPIIIGTAFGTTQYHLSSLRESLLSEIHQQEKLVRENWIKSIVKADRFSGKNNVFITKPKSYDNIDLSLKKRRQRQIRSSLKGKYNSTKTNGPFIGKQDLVKEYDIFNI